MKRKVFIALIALLLFSAIVGIFFINYRASKQDPTPSHEKFLSVITAQHPEFTDSKPFITVDTVSRHAEGWYVVTITSTRSTGATVPVKFLFIDREGTGKNLTIVLGPSAYFSPYETLPLDLPESAIIELERQ